MMLPQEFHRELLATASQDAGKVLEVSGKADHPKIVLAHQLCKVVGSAPKGYTDEIPWCSSMMNLWIMITYAKFNSKVVFSWLAQRNQSRLFGPIMAYAIPTWNNLSASQQESYKMMNPTGFMIPTPAFDGSADSWRSYGKAVELSEARAGDIACFKRAGGNHVSLFLSYGSLTITCLGGNQHDSVCVADWYLRSKLVTIRRVV